MLSEGHNGLQRALWCRVGSWETGCVYLGVVDGGGETQST